MIIKNIEDKIRLSTMVSIGSMITAIIIVCIAFYTANSQINNARKSIYILAGNTPLQATQTDMAVNRPVEYKAAVDLFHSLFFSITPDDKHIEYQMKKAMYLIDETGLNQYNNLKEKGYFNTILSSSSVLSIQTDSVVMNKQQFTFYGRQTIERRSRVTKRSLITTGYVRDIPRSENNSHGVLITNWKTLENKDLEIIEKRTL